MVQILLSLTIFGIAFAQNEAQWLERDREEYLKQLEDIRPKTEEARQKLALARKNLTEYKGGPSKELEHLKFALSVQESNIDFWMKGEQQILDQIKMNDFSREEQQLISQNTKFLNCDASTPEINLEVSGAFKDIPRDNQDGLGTCFANTAKNFLVGLSDGRDVASFTDMALQYKISDKNLRSGIDGGDACATLKVVQEKGYCSQDLSPLETGEKNPLTEVLFRRQKSLDDLSWNISSLKSFLNGIDIDTKPEYLAKAKMIIDEVKMNPNITLPLPVVRFSILEHSDPAFAKEVRIVKYGPRYKESLKNFNRDMMKALLAGKTPAEIFDLYELHMKPSYERIGFTNKLPVLREDFIRRANRDFKHKNFQAQLRASVDFMKKISGRLSDTDDAFADYCVGEGQELTVFLDSLQPILEGVKKDQIVADALLTSEGSLKKPEDLIQLMVAPTCLNSHNRQKIDFPISCSAYSFYRLKDSKEPAMEIKVLRSKVVRSLVQGLPLGNTFSIGDGSHINTIVGMRFNPKKKQCEYLIRESQVGRSLWQAEKDIYEKINLLSEIRKR